MGVIDEFKQFALKGNVVDLAVGVIIGAAFGRIVDSLVKDLTMPILGRLTGNVDFKELYINLGSATFTSLDAADKAGAPLIKYGLFINNVVNFLIIAGSVFLVVKGLSKLKLNVPAPPPPPTPEQVLLLREIRDALKAQAGDGTNAARP